MVWCHVASCSNFYLVSIAEVVHQSALQNWCINQQCILHASLFPGAVHHFFLISTYKPHMLQVTRQLRMDGWPALSIHGDKSQQERDWVLSEFKQNKSPIMLATDVAARGLGRTKLACFVLLCMHAVYTLPCTCAGAAHCILLYTSTYWLMCASMSHPCCQQHCLFCSLSQ